jgi:hypothetical protein
MDYFKFQFIYLSVFLLLTINEYNRVIKAFLLQMLNIILSKYFYFASKIIVWTFHKLELAFFFMTINALTLDFLTAFVFTIYDFEKTSLIMWMQIFIYYYRIAFLMRTIHSSEITYQLMTIHLFPSQSDLASFFKQTLTFIWAIYNFQRTINIDMFLHLSSFYNTSTSILAIELVLWTVLLYMIFHIIKR